MIIWDGSQKFLKYSEILVFGASVLKPKQFKNHSEERNG